MDFHWWMLLPLIPLAGLTFLVFRIAGIRRQARPFLQLGRADRLQFAKLLLRDTSLPMAPRLLAAAAAGYLAMPIDMIPDFIPVVGHADDFLVVTLLVAIMARLLPRGSIKRLAREASGRTAEPLAA